MKIEELLNKYFEGLTTCEEERRLRHYFTREKNLPHEWEIYRPLFACLEEEAEAFQATQKEGKHPAAPRIHRHKLLYATIGIAATMLLCIGLNLLLPHSGENMSPSFVIINGQYHDDPKLVQAKALEALQNVGFTDEELKENIIIPNLLY